MDSAKTHRSIHEIALYLLQVIVALIFVRVGLGQILDQPNVSSAFDNFDSGNWIRIVVGALELIGAVVLVSPAVSAFAAAGLAGLMMLAGIMGMGTYSPSPWLWSGTVTGGIPLAPNLLLIACVVIAWCRRGQFARRIHAV